jgi:hypothetical protein
VRLKIFRQIVEPYYLHGVDHVAALATDDPAEQEAIKKEAGVLGMLNYNTHRMIYRVFFASLLPVLIGLAGLLYFSNRWGKPASLGLVLVIVNFIPVCLLILMNVVMASAEAQG